MNILIISSKIKTAVLRKDKKAVILPLDVLENVAKLSNCRFGTRGSESLNSALEEVRKCVEIDKQLKNIVELFEATTVLEPAEYQIEDKNSIFGQGQARVFDIWLGHEVWHKVVVDHGDGSHSLHYFNVQVDNNPLDDEKSDSEAEECPLPQ